MSTARREAGAIPTCPAPEPNPRKALLMAWVEAKGSGFRVRHRRPDGTIDTETGFETRPAARKRAAQIDAGISDPAPQAPPPDQSGAEPTGRETRAPAPQPIASLLTSFVPPARRPVARELPACPTLEEWTRTWAAIHTVAPTTAAKYDSLLRQH